MKLRDNINRISLWDACARIAKQRNITSPLLDSVRNILLSALRNGDITAYGKLKDTKQKLLNENFELIAEDWRKVSNLDAIEVINSGSRLLMRVNSNADKNLFVNEIEIDTFNLDRILSTPSVISRISSQSGCKKWLEELCKSGDILRNTKKYWRDAALSRFPGLSARSFDAQWGEVAKDNPAMSRPGRPSRLNPGN